MPDARDVATGLAAAWRSYLAAPGPGAAARARVGVAAGLVLVAVRFRDVPWLVEDLPRSLYDPMGIARIWQVPLPPWLIALCLAGVVAASAVVLWRRGVAPWAFRAAVVAGLVVMTDYWSYEATWSHGTNAVLMAGLSLAAVRDGPARSDLQRTLRYGLPVRAAQALLGLFFFNAVYWKLSTSGWAWTDPSNLRDILLLRYDGFGVPRPWWLDWMVTQPLVLRALAVGNLVGQALPLLCLPFLTRRTGRTLAAGAWLLEAVALTVVMRLFGGEMIPLALVFLADGASSRSVATADHQARGRLRRPFQGRLERPVAASVALLLVALVAYEATTAFTKRDLDDRNFPVSSSSMYSRVYGPQEQRLQFVVAPDVPSSAMARFRLLYSGPADGSTPVGRERIARRVARIVAESRSRWGVDVRSVRARLVTYDLAPEGSEVVTSEPVATIDVRGCGTDPYVAILAADASCVVWHG